MCGRAELNANAADIQEAFGLARFPLIELAAPRWNVAPSYSTADKLIVRVGEAGQRELVPARWWLIPAWWKEKLNKLPTSFNARGEEVASKPMFREAFKSRHCLWPATGWYEYQGEPGKKRAYHFAVPGEPVFGFAGIWDEWSDPTTGEIITSFAILTTEPSTQAAEIHDRMPLVIAKEHHALWLDAGNPESAKLIRPWEGALEIYRSSGVGNDARYDGPDVAARWVEKPERQGSLF